MTAHSESSYNPVYQVCFTVLIQYEFSAIWWPELGIPLQQHSSLLPSKLINTRPYRSEQQFTLAVRIGWIFSYLHIRMYYFGIILIIGVAAAAQVPANSLVYSVVTDDNLVTNDVQASVPPPTLNPSNQNTVYDRDFLIQYLLAMRYADYLSNYYYYPTQSKPTYVPSRPIQSVYPVKENCKQIGEPVR